MGIANRCVQVVSASGDAVVYNSSVWLTIMWNNNVRYVQDFNWHTIINHDSTGWNTVGNSNSQRTWQILTVLTSLGKRPVVQLGRRLPFPQLPSPDPPTSSSSRLRQHWSTSGVDYCISTAAVLQRADFLPCIQWTKCKIYKHWKNKYWHASLTC